MRNFFTTVFALALILSTAQWSFARCDQDFTVTTVDDETEIGYCNAPGFNSKVIVKTDLRGFPIVYVLTDGNGEILEVTHRPLFDLSTLPQGNYRIYAVFYIGALQDVVGENIDDAEFAKYCFDVSDNFVDISSGNADDHDVFFENGVTETAVCAGDTSASDIPFFTTSMNANYTYIITDTNNVIIDTADGLYDFSTSPEGICRIWGVSYDGDLIFEIGDDADSDPLANGCYSLSNNALTVTKTSVDGGMVMTSDSTTDVAVCLGDSLTIEVVNSGMASAPYLYVLTDTNNIILGAQEDGSFDIDGNIMGTVRIWGLSLAGTLNSGIGDDADSLDVDGCFELSGNFITVSVTDVDGGMVTTTDGESEVDLCGDDPVVVENTSTSDAPYIYVITDTNNVILGVSTSDSVDVSSSGVTTCRIWGLSYAGTIIAMIGDDADSVQLVDGCSSLSSTFVTVNKDDVDGGTLTTQDSVDTYSFCPGDSATIEVTTSSTSSADYLFVLTDEDNIILGAQDNGTFEIDADTSATLRIWGLSISGTLNSGIGDDADSLDVDGCFDLSDNFITITVDAPEGGEVSAEGDTTGVIDVCVSDGVGDTVIVSTNSMSMSDYIFVVTDTNNIILAVNTSGVIDFDGAGPGICRVWGLSYSGTINSGIGDDADSLDVDGCFDLSDNFITVNRSEVDGGELTTQDSVDSYEFCFGDSATIEVSTSSTANAPYVFVITDTNNVILGVQTDGTFEIDADTATTIRIWGLSVAGTVNSGIGDDADSLDVDGCFDLSDNFITISVIQPEGGEVSIVGDTSDMTTVCVLSGDAVVEFETTSTAGGTYLFVVTDTNNVILGVSADGVVDFDSAGVGICRVWGLSYSGTLNSGIGDDADSLDVDGCFDLSDNFITVDRVQVEGGVITTQDSVDSYTYCLGDVDTLEFSTTSMAGGFYVYVVTDTNNVIITAQAESTFDIEVDTVGSFRIWGLSFVGTLLSEPGDDADSLMVDGCFDLSDNFISLVAVEPDAGVVIGPDSMDVVGICADADEGDSLSVSNTAAPGGTFLYVLTDTNNIILGAAPDATNFPTDNVPEGTYRIWGLSFVGDLLSGPGDDADSLMVDGCFDLSDNFITVIATTPEGGVVSAPEADTLGCVNVCSGDGVDDIVNVMVDSSDSPLNYIYVVTDTANVILAVSTDPAINFDGAGPGICRVWGLSYGGTINSGIGDDADSLDVSGCFDLSDNFIKVVRTEVDGGEVMTMDSVSYVEICAPGSAGDTITAMNSGGSDANYIYVITDASNVILGVSVDGTYALDTVPDGETRIWGLSYTGNILLAPGDTVAAPITDGCFALSSNFIVVNSTMPEGGEVSIDDTTGVVDVCAGDGVPDTVVVSNNSSSTATYVYVVTDTNNVILALNTTGVLDFDGAGPGVCRIWGLSVTGTVNSNIGDDADSLDVDGCFDLSDNFIVVNRYEVDGGSVAIVGDSVMMVDYCVGDGVADILNVENDGDTLASYIYVITDTNNVILGVNDNGEIDFEGTGGGVCRVWGLSFTGNVLLGVGDTVMAPITDGCFDLSDNFIVVNRTDTDGGMVMTSDSMTMIMVTVGDTIPDSVTFVNSGMADANYIYVVTDTNNVILDVSTSGVVDFEGAGEGICRVWGLSYTGNILLEPGDTVMAPITDGCFDLSDNFVVVDRVMASMISEDQFEDIFEDRMEIDAKVVQNPAVDNLKVRFNDPNTQNRQDIMFRIFNMQGRLMGTVQAGAAANGDLEIDLANYPAGMYILHIDAGYSTKTLRFIKQ